MLHLLFLPSTPIASAGMKLFFQQMKLWEKVKLFRVIASAGIEDSDASVKSAGVQRSNSKAENT